MSGDVISLSVAQVVLLTHHDFEYNSETGKYSKIVRPPKIVFSPVKGNTYINIFSRNQTKELEFFKEHLGQYIVFEGKPSKNDAHGNNHDDGAANTIVIWDYK